MVQFLGVRPKSTMVASTISSRLAAGKWPGLFYTWYSQRAGHLSNYRKVRTRRARLSTYNPRMMVALLIYAYCRGIFSSRKIMQACEERLTFRVITGDDMPNFRAISDFRKLHIQELEGLFIEVLQLCQKAGLVKLGQRKFISCSVRLKLLTSRKTKNMVPTVESWKDARRVGVGVPDT